MKFERFAVIILVVLMGMPAVGQRVLRANLTGVQETPIVVTGGRGTAKLVISADEKSINYELTFSGLEGNTVPSGQVLFAHVHVGRHTIAGGVAVFFCGGGNTAVTQAACPVSGTVSGTWTSADVVGPISQGIDPANQGADAAFARFVREVKAGLSYANVHTTRSPAGEIRGQLLARDNDQGEDR
jgi:hypothetical protein